MKKSIIPLLAIAAVACTREAPEANPSLGQIKEITITASYGDPETRTERAADGAVLWSPGDEISLFYGSGTNGGSRFVGQNTEPSKVVNFTGKIGVITGGNDVAVEDTYFWAVYPYNPTASCDGSSITTVLPSSQVAKADTFADDLFPSVGRSQGLVMGFYNICGGLKFTVSEEGIKSVTLRGHNNEILSGTLTVGFDDTGLPVVQSITDGSESITVYAPQDETFEVGKAYYIVFAPTIFENGFTLTFDKGYASAVYDRTKKTTIRRSAFGGLTTPDKDLEWTLLYVPIPDANFKAYMIQNFDTNGNGELDPAEADLITVIDVFTDDIESVSGIEYCKNLTSLRCRGETMQLDSERNEIGTGKLTNLNVSCNPALTSLDCTDNRLTSLNVSMNPELTCLRCGGNQLTSLDVNSNLGLTELLCGWNKLTSVDVSSNKVLGTLNCSYNKLLSLNLEGCTALVSLNCENGYLSSLDISSNTGLSYLNCNNNALPSLDVSSNLALKDLNCSSNMLTSLDISLNTELTKLICDDNQLLSLNVRTNTALSSLSCSNNQITSLDLSLNTGLTILSCTNNQLTLLDVSNSPELSQLYCNNNKLNDTLDVSNNTHLRFLNCGNNDLTCLVLGVNSMLQGISCNNNKLALLDVTQNPNLRNIRCYDNQLTSLDVRNNTDLRLLYCYDNLLTSLDVSNNSRLTSLDCSPMEDASGANLLECLYVALGQSINNVTIERSSSFIPDETIITVSQFNGSHEGTEDEILKGLYAVKPAPGTVLAEWEFDTSQYDALQAGGIGSVSSDDDNAPGNLGGPYVPSNVSGRGKLEYYNGSDKSSISTRKNKRRIGERGEFHVYCSWVGDYFTWTADTDAPLAAGTKIQLNFALRPSHEDTPKYWKCEVLDGESWVELDTISLDFHKDAAGTADDPKQINCLITETATLTSDTPYAQFKFTCIQNARCYDGAPVSALSSKYVLRFAGKWSEASEENTYLQVPDNPKIVVVE